MRATLKQITKDINAAIADEAENAALASHFNNMGNLPTAIAISTQSPDTGLIRFVSEYVSSLPDHLQAFHALSVEAGIGAYVQPFLNLVCTYFTNPPDLLTEQHGLQGVFYKAYLCQRILEELNDHIMGIGGSALVPMDMTMANIICHTLIGDDLANTLDHLVLLSIETSDADSSIFNQEAVQKFMAQRKFQGWDSILERWPCFSKNHGVDLQLGLE